MMLRCLSFRNTFSTMVPGVRHGFSGVREKGNASLHGSLQNRTWTWPVRDWHLGPHLLSKASPCPLAWIGPCGQNLFKNMFDYYSHPKPCKFASKADPAGGAAGESTPVPYRYDVGIADQGKTIASNRTPWQTWRHQTTSQHLLVPSIWGRWDEWSRIRMPHSCGKILGLHK